MRTFKLFFLISTLFVASQVAADDTLTDTQTTAIATNLGLYGSHTWDIAVDPMDNSYVYIATYYSPNGFFWSSDGGASWTGLPNTVDHGAGSAVEVNPDNGHVFALLSDLLISTDHGASYTVAEDYNGSGGALLYALDRLFIGSDDTVYISSDEADTFTTTIVCNGETIWSLASSSDTVYALCYNYDSEVSTLYASADSGDNWTVVDTAGVEGAEKIAIDPTTDDLFLIPSSTGGTTYRSVNADSSWTALVDAPLTGNMAFASTGRIYVGWYYSDDRGDTWTQFSDRGDYNHIVMPDPTDDTILYDTTTPGFWKSLDSGATWTSYITGITAVEVTSVSQAADKDIVWVATQNGFAKTENFTSDTPTWEYPITPTENFMSSGYDAVWVNPLDPNYVVGSSSQDLSYSTDGGATWSQADTDIGLTGAVFQISHDEAGVLYATVGPNTSAGDQSGGVITSDDFGATWTSLDFPDHGAAHAIAVASDGDIFVGTHATVGGIYKYQDSTWTKLSAPDDEFEYRAVLVDPADASTIYAVANAWPNSTDMGVYKSIDDGITWEQIVNGMGNIKSELYEFNALTLQTSTTPYTLYVSAVKNGSLKGVIYKSSDGGANWYEYYVGKKGETFKTLLFDGLVAGNTRGIFDLKSRASLLLKAHNSSLTVTLKDAATKKALKNKRVKLYRKLATAKQWTYYRTVKTKATGKVSFPLSAKKKIKLYGKWQPRKQDRREYAAATSATLTIN